MSKENLSMKKIFYLQYYTFYDKYNRPDYLQELVNEYQDTKDKGKYNNIYWEIITLIMKLMNVDNFLEAKYQVLANLANFAYDPINYDWFFELNIIDLFIGDY